MRILCSTGGGRHGNDVVIPVLQGQLLKDRDSNSFRRYGVKGIELDIAHLDTELGDVLNVNLGLDGKTAVGVLGFFEQSFILDIRKVGKTVQGDFRLKVDSSDGDGGRKAPKGNRSRGGGDRQLDIDGSLEREGMFGVGGQGRDESRELVSTGVNYVEGRDANGRSQDVSFHHTVNPRRTEFGNLNTIVLQYQIGKKNRFSYDRLSPFVAHFLSIGGSTLFTWQC